MTSTISVKNFRISYASNRDKIFLYNLFNDKLSRFNALNNKKISLKDHSKWLLKRLKKKPKILIFKHKNKAFGQVRFEKRNKTFEIDYSISKSFRNKGFSKQILANAILKGPLGKYVGKVKYHNFISQKVFKNLNFLELKNNKKFIIYTFDKEKNFHEKKILKGKRIFLRKIREKDASEKYLSWFKDPLVKKYIDSSKIENIEILKKYIKRELKKKLLFFGIYTKDNCHIGNVKLYHFNKQRSCTTIGILIGDKKWRGKKILSEVTKIISPWLYMNYGINKLISGVNNKNKYSIKGFLRSKFIIRKKTSDVTYLEKYNL